MPFLREIKIAKKGFTLIELMVAISIVAILAAVGMVMYSSAQKAGRISKRIEDLSAIRAALETYKSINGVYPRTDNVANNSGWRSECSSWVGVSSDSVIPGLVPNYMNVFPSDPSMDKVANVNCYLYKSDGNDYKVIDHLLSDMFNEVSQQPLLVDPLRSNSWAIYTGGARTW